MRKKTQRKANFMDQSFAFYLQINHCLINGYPTFLTVNHELWLKFNEDQFVSTENKMNTIKNVES